MQADVAARGKNLQDRAPSIRAEVEKSLAPYLENEKDKS